MMRTLETLRTFRALGSLKSLRSLRPLRSPGAYAGLIFTLVLAVCLLHACSSQTGSNTTGDTNVGTAGNTAGTNTDAGTAGNNEAQESASSQDSSTAGLASVQRNFYFVFDGSGSMRHPAINASDAAERKFESKVMGAKWAVHEFMAKVPEDVNLGLFVFDRKGPRQAVALGPDKRNEFLSQIDAVIPSGTTPLGKAIARGVKELEAQYKKQLGYGDFRLIVLTDGEATDNLNYGVSEAAKYKIPIYTIGFDMGATHALRKHSVSYRAADSALEVEKALEAAGAELDVYEPAGFRSVSK